MANILSLLVLLVLALPALGRRRWGYYPKPDYEAPSGKCCQICTDNFLHDLNLLELPQALEETILRRFHRVHAGAGQAMRPLPLEAGSFVETGAGKQPECCTLCPEQYVPTGWYDRHSLLETSGRASRSRAASASELKCSVRYHLEGDAPNPDASRRSPAHPLPSLIELAEGGHRQRVLNLPGCPGEHQCCYICGESDNPPRDYMADVTLFLETSSKYLEGLRQLPWSVRPGARRAPTTSRPTGRTALTAPRASAAMAAGTAGARPPRFAALRHGVLAGGRQPAGCCVQCAMKMETDEIPFPEPYAEADRRDWRRLPYSPMN